MQAQPRSVGGPEVKAWTAFHSTRVKLTHSGGNRPSSSNIEFWTKQTFELSGRIGGNVPTAVDRCRPRPCRSCPQKRTSGFSRSRLAAFVIASGACSCLIVDGKLPDGFRGKANVRIADPAGDHLCIKLAKNHCSHT